MYNYANAAPSLTNCIFMSNKAALGGGMNNESCPSVTLVNCTFSGNRGTSSGGGIYNQSTSTATLKNCILWGNSSGVDNAAGSSAVYVQTVVQGLNLGAGVFNGSTSPLFVNQPNFNNAPIAIGDLHLQLCSPALDAGTNTGAPANDLDGNPRPRDGDGTAITDPGGRISPESAGWRRTGMDGKRREAIAGSRRAQCSVCLNPEKLGYAAANRQPRHRGLHPAGPP